jgi:streptogramin lyase
VAEDGTVYVTDDARQTLLRIARGLEPETVLGPNELMEPKGLAVDPQGALHVADVGASAILIVRGSKAERYAAVPGHRRKKSRLIALELIFHRGASCPRHEDRAEGQPKTC